MKIIITIKEVGPLTTKMTIAADGVSSATNLEQSHAIDVLKELKDILVKLDNKELRAEGITQN